MTDAQILTARERVKIKQLIQKRQAEVEAAIASMQVTASDVPDWELEALERLALGIMEIVGAEIAKRRAESSE